MGLVTLAQAKRHLNISGNDRDADVDQKIEAACAAIIRHLRGRRIDVLDLSSAGGTATVETPVAHGLTSGESVSIWGTGQPEYNGTFTVTVTDANHFTFTVYGTPESPATGYVGLSVAQGWTYETVPEDVRHAVLLLLTTLYENRGEAASHDTWIAIDRLLSSHRMPAMA